MRSLVRVLLSVGFLNLVLAAIAFAPRVAMSQCDLGVTCNEGSSSSCSGTCSRQIDTCKTPSNSVTCKCCI